MAFTAEQIAAVCQVPLDAVQANAPLLKAELQRLGIYDRFTWIALLANVAEETAHTFKPIEEYGDQAYWTGELGADWEYHGRGFNQETWRTGYEWAASVTGLDCVNHPELLLIAANSARVTAEFIKMKGIPGVAAALNWYGVRRLWNGGLNGIDSVMAHVNALLALPWAPDSPPVTTVAIQTILRTTPAANGTHAINPQHQPVLLVPGTVLHFEPDPSPGQYHGMTTTPSWAHVLVGAGPVHGWAQRANLVTTGG